MRALAVVLAVALSAVACSRGRDGAGNPARTPAKAAPAAFDWDRPLAALERGPDELAGALGSFDWTASVEWTVSRDGEEARRVHTVEHHRVRQAATGEFEVRAELDPGLGPGSDSGREIVYTGGMTYAHARYAPYRERPTDRGRDARRFRDESFLSARAVTRLVGPGLELRAAGEGEALRRRVRRFTLSLAQGAAPAAVAAHPAEPAPDEDTRRRRVFLDGLRAQAASGELVLDAATGAPLRVRLSATFSVAGDPAAHASVEVVAQVKSLGAEVAAIAAPKGALPDDRKPAGVANALEAAGLKKKGDAQGRAEPDEDD